MEPHQFVWSSGRQQSFGVGDPLACVCTPSPLFRSSRKLTWLYFVVFTEASLPFVAVGLLGRACMFACRVGAPPSFTAPFSYRWRNTAVQGLR
jgi:hypothetical protein